MIAAVREAACRLRITGHAGYAPRGQDIVCAAVSALWETLATELSARAAAGEGQRTATYAAVGDVLAFDPADAHRREITALFDMVWRGLTAIAQSYGTYVKVIDLTQRPAGERAERSDTWTST